MPYLRGQSIVAYAREQAAETYPRGRAFVPCRRDRAVVAYVRTQAIEDYLRGCAFLPHNASAAGPSWSACPRGRAVMVCARV